MKASVIINIVLLIVIIVLVLIYVLFIVPKFNGMLEERTKLLKLSNIFLTNCRSSLSKYIEEKNSKNSKTPLTSETPRYY